MHDHGGCVTHCYEGNCVVWGIMGSLGKRDLVRTCGRICTLLKCSKRELKDEWKVFWSMLVAIKK